MTTRLFGWGIRYVSPEIGMRSVSRFMLPKNSFRMLDIVEITFFGCWWPEYAGNLSVFGCLQPEYHNWMLSSQVPPCVKRDVYVNMYVCIYIYTEMNVYRNGLHMNSHISLPNTSHACMHACMDACILFLTYQLLFEHFVCANVHTHKFTHFTLSMISLCFSCEQCVLLLAPVPACWLQKLFTGKLFSISALLRQNPWMQ